MRYTVGTQVPFISLEFTRSNDSLTKTQIGMGSTYYPWCDTLVGMTMVKLTCEHHIKVPNEWDPDNKPDFDGFIFADPVGDYKWNNQYPKESNGQLSTESDYNVNRSDGDDWLSMIDAAHYLENVFRGVSQLSESGETMHHDALLAHYTVVVGILSAANIITTIKPYQIGDRILKNRFKVTFS